jgi:low temperature requirement protein LtrA
MSLISLVIVLIVVGVLLWLVTTYIPMDATIKKIITAVVIIAVVLWLLSVFHVLPDINAIRIGR